MVLSKRNCPSECVAPRDISLKKTRLVAARSPCDISSLTRVLAMPQMGKFAGLSRWFWMLTPAAPWGTFSLGAGQGEGGSCYLEVGQWDVSFYGRRLC